MTYSEDIIELQQIRDTGVYLAQNDYSTIELPLPNLLLVSSLIGSTNYGSLGIRCDIADGWTAHHDRNVDVDWT